MTVELSDLERQIRRVALAEGVDPEQMTQAEAALDKMRSLGLGKRDLADVLVQLQFIAEPDAEDFRARARTALEAGESSDAPMEASEPTPAAAFASQRAHDRLFAKMAKGGNLAEHEAIDAALQVQESLFLSEGEIRPLATLLADRGVLSPDECAWIDSALASARPATSSDVTAPPPAGDVGLAAPPEAAPNAIEARRAAKEAAREAYLAEGDAVEVELEVVPDAPAPPTPEPPPSALEPPPSRLDATAPLDASATIPLDPKVAEQLVAEERDQERDEAPADEPPSEKKRRRVGPMADDLAPPSKLDADGEPVRDGDTREIPAAAARKRRRLPSLRSLMFVGLILAGVGVAFGIHALVQQMDAAAEDEAFHGAMRLVRQQDRDEAEKALRAYLEQYYPDGTNAARAMLELQQLILNRGEVDQRLGLFDQAIAAFREVRSLDPESEPAATATTRLAEVEAKRAEIARGKAWATFVATVERLIAARSYQTALETLARPPFEDLSGAEARTRDDLREQARTRAAAEALKTFVFLPPAKLKLPELAAPIRPPTPRRPVKRYRLGSRKAVVAPSDASPPGTAFAILGSDRRGKALYALDARTGEQRWRRDLGAGRAFAPLGVRLGVDDGSGRLPPQAVVVDGGRRTVVLLDADTGRVRWQRTLPADITAQPVTDDAHVLVGTRGGRLYLLELDTGAVAGAFVVGGEVVAAPTYDPASDLLAVGAADGFCYLYALEDRRFVGRVSASPHPGVPPIVVDNLLFVPSPVGNATRLVVLQLDIDRDENAGPLDTRELARFEIEGRLRTPAVVTGGRVYLITDTGVLGVYALDPDTDNPVYSLTKEGGGRSVLQRGSVRILVRELGRKILLVGEDLQLYDLPKLEKHTERKAFKVALSWRHEDIRNDQPPIHGQVTGTPTVSGDWLLFTTREPDTVGQHVYAYDMKARKTLWHRTLGSGATGAALRLHDAGHGDGEQAPKHGRLVIATEDGALHCVCFHGAVPNYRRMAAGDRQLSYTGMARDGDALLVGRGRSLTRVDSVTGEPARLFELDFGLKSDIRSGPVVAGGLAYFGTRGGAMYAVDAATGRTKIDLFSTVSGKGFSTQPLVVGDLVVAGALDHGLYGLETAAIGARKYLRKRWRIDMGGELHVDPLTIGEAVWAASDSGKLLRITPAKGEIQATVTLPAAIRGPLVASKDLIVLATIDRKVHAVDTAAAKIRWSRPIAGLVRTAPLVTDDLVYVATTAGKVYALARADGAVRWQIDLPARFDTGRIHEAGGKLYVVSRHGYLYEIAR